MVQKTTKSNSAIPILRYIGYGLLVFSAIDIATILYPPQFTNPSWELQTIGGIVERVPVPLIGFGFVFLGEPSQWKIPERVLLNLTSFLSLVVAALFLFLVPLGIVNTIRINNENTETITTQSEQQIEQIEQLKSLVGDANPQNLAQLAQRLNSQENPIEANNPEELRSEIRSRLEQQQDQIQQQAENTQSQRRRNLLENAAKWITGALLSCVLFAIIFLQTAWVRKLPLKKKKQEQPKTTM
ncbi:HpsJ-like protein, cyanoexosortase A-associated [Dactylococcopsis salina]|uniref:Uncharacterized protein n=1 Tax=Dactylococcopsis salina (strain PCC 8305) TaxID=13035 RepID=K9YQY0_DACS8|nr:HpsJ family protein [Dactylococcopsis salina]AFZ48877.1 hypothetical protein Dacsa_0057 [Dactylococcopsis salina PCC 8305]